MMFHSTGQIILGEPAVFPFFVFVWAVMLFGVTHPNRKANLEVSIMVLSLSRYPQVFYFYIELLFVFFYQINTIIFHFLVK